MSLNILEKISRQGNAARESSELLRKGFITPAEHKSLSSLSWQIAANVRANGSSVVASKIGPINMFW
jgi:hypothetical protein